MNTKHKTSWLILAVLPFLMPILLLIARWSAGSLIPNPAAQAIFDFVMNFWWLMIIVTVVLVSIAFLLHAQHSKVIPDDSRQGWTLLILFLGPYAVPFYYWKFIAPLESTDA